MSFRFLPRLGYGIKSDAQQTSLTEDFGQSLLHEFLTLGLSQSFLGIGTYKIADAAFLVHTLITLTHPNRADYRIVVDFVGRGKVAHARNTVFLVVVALQNLLADEICHLAEDCLLVR